MAAASLPTRYLLLAFSDVIAFRITSATCIGDEELFSNMGLNPSDTFFANSAYGELELAVFLAALEFSKKLVFTTPGSISMTFIPNSSNSYCIDSENPSKANLLLI